MAELSDVPADGQADGDALSPAKPSFAQVMKPYFEVHCIDSLGRIWVTQNGVEKKITEKEITKRFLAITADDAVWAEACGTEKLSLTACLSKILAAARAVPVKKITIEATALNGNDGHDSAVIAGLMKDDTIFDEYSRGWYSWDRVWRPISAGDVQRRVVARLDDAFDGEYSNGDLSGTFSIMQTRLGRSPSMNLDCTASLDGWSQDKNMLPMANGVLNLLTKKLSPHSSKNMLNWILPHNYQSNAKCPTVDGFLKEMSNGDPFTEQVLLAFLNCVLVGRSDLQKYLECVGLPGTGKSTYLKLCTALVGETNVMSTSMNDLNNNKFETAAAYGKRLVVITDADKYGGKVDVFKSITGQDPIRFEEKNKQVRIPFIYGGMVIVAANQAVQFSDSSTAMVRRRVPVQLDKVVAKDDVDSSLNRKLCQELPGLINKLLAMSDATVNDIMRDRHGKRRESENRAMCETNPIAAWANDCLIIDPSATVKVGDANSQPHCLYPSYIQYQALVGRRGTQSMSGFISALNQILQHNRTPYEKKTSGNSGARYEGIRIRDQNDSKIPPLLYGEGIQNSQSSAQFQPEDPFFE